MPEKPCVARFFFETGIILCGLPDKQWKGSEDILTSKERMQRSEAGRCKRCASFSYAMDRLIAFHSRKGQGH